MQNCALACFLISKFVFKYEELTAGTRSPEILKTLLVLPILWHKVSCEIVSKKKTATSFRAVLMENHLIRNGLQDRIEAFTPVALQGVNLACASKLLKRELIEERPVLTTCFARWPKGSSPVNAPTEMLLAIDRLAFWFKDFSDAELFAQILKD
jgi:hypothetical protein